jgi:hypothetical protein
VSLDASEGWPCFLHAFHQFSCIAGFLVCAVAAPYNHRMLCGTPPTPQDLWGASEVIKRKSEFPEFSGNLLPKYFVISCSTLLDVRFYPTLNDEFGTLGGGPTNENCRSFPRRPRLEPNRMATPACRKGRWTLE